MATATRTIEPGISCFTAAEIRVAVLPVGPVPKDVLDEYQEVINKHRHVPLNATKPFYRESQKSPFQHMPWKTGSLHFRFLQEDEARRRTRILDLHSQRQVLAVLGIIHCPLVADVSAAYKEFQRICKQFPEALVCRCFAFEPSEQHVTEQTQNLQDLVLFPLGSEAHLQQHLEAYMHEFAAGLLGGIEALILNANIAQIKLNTYVDSGEFTGSLAQIEEGLRKLNINEDELKEKKKWGRLQKAKGDYALLCGSPLDAFEHYKSSMELSRHANDAVWHAAAVEGTAHARIMETVANVRAASSDVKAPRASLGAPAAPSGIGDNAATAEAGGGAGHVESTSSGASARTNSSNAEAGKAVPPGFPSAAMWEALRRAELEDEVRELFGEARSWYRKKGGALVLQIEQQLKLARLLAGLHGINKRREVSEMMAFVLECVPSLHLLEDRLVALVEAAQVMGLVGCGRKRTLLLWHATDLSRSIDKSEATALRIAIKALEAAEHPQQQDPDDLPKVHWSISHGRLPCAWESVHVSALEGALSAARQANAPVEAWEAAAALLRQHHPYLSQQYQASLIEAMAQAAGSFSNRARTRPGRGPGPLVQLKRALPAPPALQPLHLSAAAAGRKSDTGHGPFIFNPYAAKRQLAAVSHGLEFNQPEWVCGDECRVEVLLSNPCAVAVKLEQLVLDVSFNAALSTSDQQQQQQQQAESSTTGFNSTSKGILPSAGDDASSSGTPAASGVAVGYRLRPVAVTLSAKRKDLRLLLALTPTRPGALTIKGVKAMCWGVTWHEPFTSAAKLGSSEGRGRLQSPITVTVLPSIPSLKATLSGAELQAVHPTEEELQGAGQGSDLAKKANPVNVFEGQLLSWTLTLANTSQQPVRSCQVAVVNAKGAVVKPLGGAQPPASFVGAHLEVLGGGDVLSGGAALEVGRSVSLPVALHVGRAPADAFEEVLLELQITYSDTPEPAVAGDASTSPAGSSTSAAARIGRRLAIPLKFTIQSTLQVTMLRFLEHTVPLTDGSRCIKPKLDVRDANLTRGDSALYRSSTMRQGGAHHTRNSSDSAIGLAAGPSGKALLGPHEPAEGLWSPKGSTSKTPGTSTSAMRSDATATASSSTSGTSSAGKPGSRLSLTTECILELGVRNCSERYFRTWLARLPGRPSADAAESAVVVLEPGDNVRLLCNLPASLLGPEAAVGAGGDEGGQGVMAEGGEARRMRVSERLAERLAVCWEMITGDMAPDKLPRGLVRLSTVDVARSLTPNAVAALFPSQLHLSFQLLPGPPEAAPLLLHDLTVAIQGLGLKLANIIGQVWGLRLGIGQMVDVEVQLRIKSAEAAGQALDMSLSVVDLCSSISAVSADARRSMDGTQLAVRGSDSGGGAHSSSGAAVPGAAIDDGVLLTGSCERFALGVPPVGEVAVQPLSLLFVRQGFYQLSIVDMRAAEDGHAVQQQQQAQLRAVAAPGSQRRIYCAVDKFYVLVGQ